jgi:hypothetical protein
MVNRERGEDEFSEKEGKIRRKGEGGLERDECGECGDGDVCNEEESSREGKKGVKHKKAQGVFIYRYFFDGCCSLVYLSRLGEKMGLRLSVVIKLSPLGMVSGQ